MGMHYRLRGPAALGLLGAVSALSLLAACDSGPSALPTRDRSAAAVEDAPRALADRPAQVSRHAEAEVPSVDGKPMWAANRKHTAQENAQYQFERNGADFGADTLDAFVAKAHDFTADPPKGVAVLKRSNGDRLMYDAKANIFAVVTKDGAPRTMFKPKDGAAYWDKQKEREAQYASRRKAADDDQG